MDFLPCKWQTKLNVIVICGKSRLLQLRGFCCHLPLLVVASLLSYQPFYAFIKGYIYSWPKRLNIANSIAQITSSLIAAHFWEKIAQLFCTYSRCWIKGLYVSEALWVKCRDLFECDSRTERTGPAHVLPGLPFTEQSPGPGLSTWVLWDDKLSVVHPVPIWCPIQYAITVHQTQ